MGIRSGQAPNLARAFRLLTQGHLEGAFQVQQIMAGLRRGPRVPTVPPCKFGKSSNFFIRVTQRKRLTCFIQLSQGWTKKAERIHCPAPLPEEPAVPLLTKMLVPAPYKVPKKTTEKDAKKTRGGLRRRGTSDTISEGSDAHSASEEDEKEEEDESPAGGRRKRTASAPLEAELPKRGNAPLLGESPAAAASGPEIGRAHV